MKSIVVTLCLFSTISCSTSNNEKETLEIFLNLVEKNQHLNQTQLQKHCKKGIEIACLSLGQIREIVPRYSIVQGATDTNTTQFSVVRNQKETLYYWILDENGESNRLMHAKSSHHDWRSSDWKVDQIFYGQLKLNLKYKFVVTNQNGSVVDLREFGLLNLNKNNLLFSISSCMDDSFKQLQETMWNQIIHHNADMHFFIGDNVYADSRSGNNTKPLEIWNRYVQTRRTLKIFFAKQLKPIFAIWDDHDFGRNNGGRLFKYKLQSAKIFKSFWPQKDLSQFKNGPGVSSVLSSHHQSFIFLDNRSFRSPNNKKLLTETHWGTRQEKWLYSLLDQQTKFAWIINGDQIFGNHHPWESYQNNHPNSLKKTLKKLSSFSTKLVFVSGDRHLSEITSIAPSILGYKSYELTSSGIHAKVFAGSHTKYPNPNQLAGSDGKYNYMIVRANAKKTGLKMSVTSYTKGNKILFRKNFEIK